MVGQPDNCLEVEGAPQGWSGRMTHRIVAQAGRRRQGLKVPQIDPARSYLRVVAFATLTSDFL